MLGLAGIGVFVYAILRPDAGDPSSSEVEALAPTPTTVAALGRIEPQGGIVRVAPPSDTTFGGQRIARILVQEGDRVEAGQIVGVMDNGDRLQAAALQAEAEVQEAQSRLIRVQAGAQPADIRAEQANVERLLAQLQNAQREYTRYQLLYEEGAISASELETRQLEVVTVQRDLERAQQVLRGVRRVRPVDLQVAESQVQVAIANLQRARTELETAVVRAPIAGQVIRINAEPGEAIGDDGILELGNTRQMQVVAEVYETDITKVQVGQTATIRSEAFPGTVTGVVEKVGLLIDRNDVIDTDPTARTDSRVVEVEILLNDSAPVANLTNLQVDVLIDI